VARAYVEFRKVFKLKGQHRHFGQIMPAPKDFPVQTTKVALDCRKTIAANDEAAP